MIYSYINLTLHNRFRFNCYRFKTDFNSSLSKIYIMKRLMMFSVLTISISISACAQQIKESKVPTAVAKALHQKYPTAKGITWEKEKTNYEANWGGKSGEDNSVQFTPTGAFIEIVNAIPVNQLPKSILTYVATHYKGAKINEAGKVTNAQGITTYEVEVNKKDIIFDEKGAFVKVED